MTAAHSASPRRTDRRILTLLIAVVGVLITAALVIGFALRADARVLTGNETRGRTVIQNGETWTFDPNRNITLIMTGNLVVNGTLEMKPNPGFTHVIEFRGNEANFVGGGMDEITSDVGLWVLGNGRLDIDGEDKPAWDYKWHSSWDGDLVMAAPNTPGSYGFTQVDNASEVPGKNSLGYNTELLNLSRNAIIRGTSTNYTHVFIRSTRPSSIKNALIRYVAPDFGSSADTGRYGLHLHHNHHGSMGTVIDGVVIRDTKTHAFVPHESHGITFRNVIAYDVRGEAYWWDPGETATDIVYDRAVAANVRGAANGEHHSLGAFNLGLGSNMTVSNSVVVGMKRENAAQRSAYIWPEDEEATWIFRNNIAHNNEVNGIFVWQNNEDRHIIEDFTAYYNGQSGIEHGAYTNSYVYNGLTLLQNGTAAIHSHANGEAGEGGWVDTQIWANVKTNGGRLLIDQHERDPERPVRFVNCDFGNVDVNDAGGAQPGRYDFINCGLERGDFDLSGAHPQTEFRVQRSNGTAFRLTGTGSFSNISKFYNGLPIPGGGSAAPGGFSDVAGNTHQNAIVWLAEEGITRGCNPPTNDRFCPDDPVTRGQMAAFLVRAFGYTNAGTGDYFEDTGGNTFEGDIDRLRVAGVTLGCNPPDNDEFCPDDPVTRGQMAAFLVRAFGYTNPGTGDYFEDTGGNTFEGDIDRLRVAGVTRGCNPPANDRYCPENPVTRAEMATFLHRAITG